VAAKVNMLMLCFFYLQKKGPDLESAWARAAADAETVRSTRFSAHVALVA
jgi:hypothetical protein